MSNQQSSTNTTMLVLLRISLILIATLAVLLFTARHMDGQASATWLYLVGAAGGALIASELVRLSRLLSGAASPEPEKARQHGRH